MASAGLESLLHHNQIVKSIRQCYYGTLSSYLMPYFYLVRVRNEAVLRDYKKLRKPLTLNSIASFSYPI